MIVQMPEEQFQQEASQRTKVLLRTGPSKPLSEFDEERQAVEAKLAGYGYTVIIWFSYSNLDSIRAAYAISASKINYVGSSIPGGSWIAYGLPEWEKDLAMMVKLAFGGA